jgi:hypothetical protein
VISALQDRYQKQDSGIEIVQIADGRSGPMLEQVDVLNGTIFEDNNDGVFPGSYLDPWVAYVGTVTAKGTVAASGTLAFLTVSTSGLTGGQFALSLTDAPEGITAFGPEPADITNGTLVIVPEPAAGGALLAGAVWLLRRRKGRAQGS